MSSLYDNPFASEGDGEEGERMELVEAEPRPPKRERAAVFPIDEGEEISVRSPQPRCEHATDEEEAQEVEDAKEQKGEEEKREGTPLLDEGGETAAHGVTTYCYALADDEERIEEGGDEDEANNVMDEAEDEYSALLLQVAELKSDLSCMNMRNHFERRMAEREAKTLEHYLEEKKRWLKRVQDLQRAQFSHAEGASMLPMANVLAANVVGERESLRPVLSAATHDARVVAAFLRLVDLTEQYKRQQAQTLRRHHLLQDIALCSTESGPDSLEKVKQLSARLLQSIGEPLQKPVRFLAEPQLDPTAQANDNAGFTSLDGQHQLVLQSFAHAFQHFQHSSPRREEALCESLKELSKLSTCWHDLRGYCSRQAEKDAAIEEELEALLLPTQEWSLMAAQAMLCDEKKHLSISAAFATRPPIIRNNELKWHLAELQTALTTLIVAHAMGSLCKEPKFLDKSNSVTTADEAEEEEAKLEKLRGQLALEVMVLRRKLRATGNPRYWQHALEDSTKTGFRSNHAPANTILSFLGRLLLSEYHKKLEMLFSPSCEHRVGANESSPPFPSRLDGSNVPSEGYSSQDTYRTSALTQSMRLLLLREQVESHHQSLASLLAANVRLIDSIGKVRMIYALATEPEKAGSLVDALLMRCGFGLPSQGHLFGDEENHDFAPSFSSFLTQLQERVLEKYHKRLEALETEANACLERLQFEVWQQDRCWRANLSFLLRIQYLSDLRQLTAISGKQSAAVFSSEEELRRVLDCLGPNEEQIVFCPVDEGGGNFGDPLKIPALPRSVGLLQKQFEDLHSSKVHSQKTSWSTHLQECAANREEFEWYEQFTMEKVPDVLEEAKILHKRLGQDIAVAQQSRRQLLLERERAFQLDKAFNEILENRMNPLQARVNELKAQLQRLQEENKAAMDKKWIQPPPDELPDAPVALHSFEEAAAEGWRPLPQIDMIGNSPFQEDDENKDDNGGIFETITPSYHDATPSQQEEEVNEEESESSARNNDCFGEYIATEVRNGDLATTGGQGRDLGDGVGLDFVGFQDEHFGGSEVDSTTASQKAAEGDSTVDEEA